MVQYLPYSDELGNPDTLTLSLVGIGKPALCPNATIETVNNGSWTSPSTWNTLAWPPSSAVPGPNDIVRINNGHTVTAPSSTIKVKALCINKEGTLVSKNALGSPLRVDAKDFITNKGTIKGKKGCNGLVPIAANPSIRSKKGIDDSLALQPLCRNPRRGASVYLTAGKVCYSPWSLDKPVLSLRNSRRLGPAPFPYYRCYYNGQFDNSGTITAGKGGSGIRGQSGGYVSIRAGDMTFNAQSGPPSSCGMPGSLCAGDGGNSSTGPAGWGGSLFVMAGKKGPFVTPTTASSLSARKTRFQAGYGRHDGRIRLIADNKAFSSVALIAGGPIYIDPTGHDNF
ncbi:MAG: hypothetical protein VSS75_020790 [Candidatus Parabeggiatoa sp.]|nr:hypothetical protein [Candidatus Parabeggiatoa sp.]